ncbi:ankyrin repeat-containing domain protein, partial [Baffinella frigidus]
VAILLLDKHADPKAAADDGTTPLHLASQYDRLGIVRALVQAGANPNAVDEDGHTPLHLAALKGATPDCSRG